MLRHTPSRPGPTLARSASPGLRLASPRWARSTGCALLASLVATASTASAQGGSELTFSVDFSGPTIGSPGTPVGTPVTDADLLVRAGGPFTPTAPRIALVADFLTSYTANCVGHAPGVACGLEVNAISFGRDARLQLDTQYEFRVLFSVDEFAVGRPSPAGSPFTDVFRERQGREAAADLFFSSFTGIGPFNAAPNVAYADGSGTRVSQGAPYVFGLGLVEPIVPDQGVVDTGDNLDAIDYGAPFDASQDTLFFSMEGAFERCNEVGGLFPSAAQQVLVGSTVNARSSDVLQYQPAIGVSAYARGLELGLDQLGPGVDDIDALMVVENGQPGYQPPINLYDWDGSNGSDLILFSVRCNSAIVGAIDLVSNRAIGEGDILIKLAGTPGPPQIFIPAEALGLRSVAAGDMENDELNGLDIFDGDEDPFLDCNMNNIDDAVDITDMNSLDIDNNGIPDECEDDWSVFCGCSAAVNSPCGNTAGVGRGCRNVSMLGARLSAAGTTSISSDSLQLVATDLNPTATGVLFGGFSTTSVLVQNGRLCVVPSGNRLGVGIASGGTVAFGPGLISAYPGTVVVMPGTTFNFQVYYRDLGAGVCGGPGNYTNALAVPFTP